MALDATVGGVNSNSYVTVEEADLYFAERFHGTAKWTSITVATEKESLLITSSKLLDWSLNWKGTKVLDAQAMQWPRQNVLRVSGAEVLTTIIPNDVKTAVFELALLTIPSDRTADNSLAGLSEVKAGPLMIKSNGSGYGSTQKQTIPDHIKNILKDLTLNSGLSVVRLMRA